MIKKPKVIFVDWNKTLSNSLFQHNRHLINQWMRGKYTSEDITRILSNDSGVPQEIILYELIES